MKPSEILDKAAELLEEKGWCQRREMDPSTGAMCARGAIKRAIGARTIRLDKAYFLDDLREEEDHVVAMHAMRYVKETTGADHIPHWNDSPMRTADEVITSLRHAAKFAKEDEDAAA
jgi:hypothetical protein